MSAHSDERAAELRELFFQSAQELVQALNEQGLALEREPGDGDALGEIRRLVHTLKGDAAACGFRELSELAHEVEDVLAPEVAPANAASLPEVVLAAADMFDAFCAAYRAHLPAPSGDPLRALIWRIAQQSGVPRASAHVAASFSWSEYDRLAMAEAAGRGLNVFEVALGMALECPMRTAGAEVLKKALQQAGTLLASSPEEPQWAEAAKVEFALATEHREEWVAARCRIPGVVADVVVEKFVPAVELTEGEAASQTNAAAPSAVGASGIPAASAPAAADAALSRVSGRAENTVRVDAERIDNLLNLVGELVIGKSMLHQTLNEFSQRFPKDPLRGKFADAMAFQSQVLNALQRSAMKIRMVPVEQLFRRFPRLVRDVARLCGKEVALSVSGAETEMDKGLLDTVAEPMVHLVRNAVDHGIETPAERRAAGKAEQGTIHLHACHQGNQVVIEIRDDGRGIDVPAVLAKAVSSGLASAEQAAHMADGEAVELIFQPGFSTAGQVSEISGRGIGMDVVKATVQKLKGSISIETQPGHGATFQLRLPLTLAIIRAMLFRVSGRMYALPLPSVVEITRVEAADIHRVDNHEVLQFRNQVLTVVRLNRLAPAPPESAENGGRAFAIIIASGERKFGLLVDKLVGEEELVIKPLDETVVGSDLASGASILGDGTVVLILNVAEVVRKLAAMRAVPAATARPGNGRSLEAMA